MTDLITTVPLPLATVMIGNLNLLNRLAIPDRIVPRKLFDSTLLSGLVLLENLLFRTAQLYGTVNCWNHL